MNFSPDVRLSPGSARIIVLAARASSLSILLSLSLAGCGGDERPPRDTSPKGPDGTEPMGAINMEVYAEQSQTCPPGNIHIDIGTVNSSPAVLVVDGFEGAKVTCSVVKSGGAFKASGSIEQGDLAWAFTDLTADGPSAIAQVEFTDPKAGTRYLSNVAKPCVFQFAPGSLQGVDAGHIFVQFDCPDLVSVADPTNTCSSRYGYVRLENCAK